MDEPKKAKEAESQSSEPQSLAVSEYQSKDAALHPDSKMQTVLKPSDTPRTCDTPTSSESSFPSCGGRSHSLHGRTEKGSGAMEIEVTAAAQALRNTGSPFSTQISPEDDDSTFWTSESCSAESAPQIDFIHSIIWTPESLSVESAPRTEFINTSLISEDLDVHNSPLALWSPDSGGYMDIEGDIALVDMEVIGIGEQFVGYEAQPKLIA